MKKARVEDKQLVIDILSRSFNDNQSVNYIVKQGSKREFRLKELMAYSFDICYQYGKVYLSDNNAGCALVLYPDKKSAIKTIPLDLRLIFKCIGIENAGKAMKREGLIKKQYPSEPIYYLWFIGVLPDHQHNGTGTALLTSLMDDARQQSKPIYLETSTIKNISWYQNFGFNVYHELDFGYKLFMLKGR
jgi:ribosomal protein S18 acetylase RimI-like enzyme